jgi:hypothetical protein
MAAEDNLSRELFFEAHRGLREKNPDPQYGLGIHFSSSENVAQKFAARVPWEHGTIIHAKIPMSSVETDTKTLGQRGYAGFIGKLRDPLGEKEVPVKEGASVFVTGKTSLKPAPPLPDGERGERRSRKRTYNPPREMKA